MVDQARRVFLSHTSELRDHPAGRSFIVAAEAAIARAGDVVSDMAYFTARDEKPAEYCRQAVQSCDIYLGILGFRYGSPVREDPAKSYVELEHEAALQAGIPRLMFLLSDTPTVVLSRYCFVDDAYGARQDNFRDRIRSNVNAIFDSPSTLETLVYQALTELRKRIAVREALIAEPQSRPTRDLSQLPPDLGDFTGQRLELEAITATLTDDQDEARTAIPILTISGQGGVGKTTLAIRAAHALRQSFQMGSCTSISAALRRKHARQRLYCRNSLTHLELIERTYLPTLTGKRNYSDPASLGCEFSLCLIMLTTKRRYGRCFLIPHLPP